MNMEAVEKSTEVTEHHEEIGKNTASQIGGSSGRLENELPKGYFYSSMFIGTYLACAFGLAGGVGAYSLAAPVLGVINNDIGPSANITWVAITYILMLAIGSTLVGRVTDIFGRRWFFVGGSILAIIGNIVCATAQSVPVLIGGMTLNGAATAAQASFAFVLGELVPIKWRFLANAGLYAIGFPYNTFSPKIAIGFVNTPGLGWRWCFYMTLIANCLSALCWFFFYHPPTFHMLHRGKSAVKLLKKFDYVGFVLFTGGLTLAILGLAWGGSIYPWDSAHVIATLVIGFVALVVFVFWEIFAPLEEPYVPMHLFRNRHYNAVVVTVSVVAMTYYAFSIVWPSMLGVLYDSTPEALGWKTCAAASMVTLGDFFGLMIASFIRRLRYLMVTCMAIGTVFVGTAALANQHNEATAISLIAIGCFFTGIVEAIALTMSSIAIDNQDEIGAAVGVAASIRSLGGTVASTVYVTILTNRLETTIPAIVPAAVVGAGLPPTSVVALLEALEGLIPFTQVPGATPEIIAVALDAYRTANSQAYSTIFLVTIAFGVLGIIGTCFCPDTDPATEYIVAKELHRRKDEKYLEAANLEDTAKN